MLAMVWSLPLTQNFLMGHGMSGVLRGSLNVSLGEMGIGDFNLSPCGTRPPAAELMQASLSESEDVRSRK